MSDLKRMFVLALVLVFLGGLGTGAWIGSLTAGPQAAAAPDDTRVEDFERLLTLNASQVRQLRAILDSHDSQIRRIKQELNASQQRRKLQVEERSRAAIRAILTKEQQREYDKLLRPDKMSPQRR